jgi:homoserine dehydrogenase
LRLILAGFGTVGRAFAELLLLKENELAGEYGLVPRVVAIIDSKGSTTDDRGLDLAKALRQKEQAGTVVAIRGGSGAGVTRTTDEVIETVEADVLVETTPTNFKNGQPGLGHLRAAFISRKHVVTSNKGPVGVAFQALHELARHNGVQFKYSGAVGGGTPILDFGRTCSIGDDITSVTGILNGTCNFILTRMEMEGVEFAEALERAQAEGYAEKDPFQDIEGFDSAVKLTIIANHLKLSRATLRDVRVSGISHITSADVRRARDDGRALRLVATADERLSVGPELLSRDDPLCVSGAYNAVKFDCRFSGPKVIVGKGAGGPETAASLLRDLIQIREEVGNRGESRR